MKATWTHKTDYTAPKHTTPALEAMEKALKEWAEKNRVWERGKGA
jgi:hypothetical protein